MSRKIRLGMVGGGTGAFIGDVHRKAAALDGQIELVCGAFSSSAERSRESGKQLFLPEDRVYGTFKEMFEKESALPEGERMDVVSIVTPNHMHFPPAKMALENGFHVICDKPMTVNLEEALVLRSLVRSTGLIFALTHNYTGYPMVKQARHMIREGVLGELRKVVVEYPQGWLSSSLESEGNKQASWRTDPKLAGPAGALGDIGTHAENLAEYVSGLQISKICADLGAVVKGRKLDDDCNILLRFHNGARGVLHASQISIGEENNLKIYIYGDKAGIEWHQHEPNTLIVRYPDKPAELYRAGVDHGYLSEASLVHTRIPSGHPEGFIEAFANIYRNVALAVRRRLEGSGAEEDSIYDFPGVEDGVRGLAFVEAVIASSESDRKWTDFNPKTL
ncbi:MAG: Gfo/Idh/MocA family oxidoreductase [Balneolaceae bacterium]